MLLNKSEAWLRWVVRGRSASGMREKFVLGPLERCSVTNWGEGDEWGHSLGLMKELLLGLECGWAHLHHIGVAQTSDLENYPGKHFGTVTPATGRGLHGNQALQSAPGSFLNSASFPSVLKEVRVKSTPRDILRFFLKGRCQWLSHVKTFLRGVECSPQEFSF